jgi:hypothetical protein
MATKDRAKNYQYVKEWRLRNPEKRAEQDKRYAQRHPETGKKASRKYLDTHRDRLRPIWAEQARKRRQDPEKQRKRNKAFKERLEKKRIEMAGRPKSSICEICRTNEFRIVFDHCHTHGHFRGWICDRCNRVLGLVRDNSKLLKKMAKYLEINNGAIDNKTTERTPLEVFFGTR